MLATLFYQFNTWLLTLHSNTNPIVVSITDTNCSGRESSSVWTQFLQLSLLDFFTKYITEITSILIVFGPIMCIWFYIIGLTLLININKVESSKLLFNNLVSKILPFAEQELTLSKLVLVVLFSFQILIINLFLTNFNVFTNPMYYNFIILALIILIFIIFFFPIGIIFEYRFFFIVYIKGEIGLKTFLFELIMDYINLVAFFLRINIQLIRIVIFSCIFFMYNEMYFEQIYPYYVNFNNANIELITLIDYLYFYSEKFFFFFGYVLYELSHFWVLFFMQNSAFTGIITILMQFLYTCYLIKKVELYFNILRKKLNN